MRRFIPSFLKVQFQLIKRKVMDFRNGNYNQFAGKKTHFATLPIAFSLEQDLFPNETKIHNLKKAIQSIEKVYVQPTEIFSFWKAVGNPNAKNGFMKSRSLINGEIQSSVGGGLCQLSGLIYFLSLHTSLEILERHNHSVDIYNDTTRFTPLGSDATVSFGYKDVRIKNTSDAPFYFSFLIKENSLTIRLHSSKKIIPNLVSFSEDLIKDDQVEVSTFINGKFLGKSTYKKIEL